LYPNGESIVLPEIPTEYLSNHPVIVSVYLLTLSTAPRTKMITLPRSPTSPYRNGRSLQSSENCCGSNRPWIPRRFSDR
jgi:hypothetical protein